MVHNRFVALDEGILKSIPELKRMPIRNYMKECMRKNARGYTKRIWDDTLEDYTEEYVINEDQKPYPPKVAWWFKERERKSRDIDYQGIWTPARERESWLKFQESNLEIIHEYLGIIPFIPSLMINISPNWKGHFNSSVSEKIAIKKFCQVIDSYLSSCKRYNKWKYAIEYGGEGNFIHSHIVAEINPDYLESVLNGKRSHVRQGNVQRDIRKLWDKSMPEGFEGMLRAKYAIQTIILRNEQLRDDKLAYLLEENKPAGHENKREGLLFEGP